MNIREKILRELKNPHFPDLKFFYSSEVLDLAPEILEELLEEEKKDFEKKLEILDSEINFETFEDFSFLDYFFGILEHYQGVHNDEKIRKIIEDFEPKYIDFSNEVSYSKRYYEMLKICHSKLLILIQNLSQFSPERRDQMTQQIRIIEQSIEVYEIRGIALPEAEQNELKNINKNLSELTQIFGNNILDSQKDFEYIIKDETLISQMPEDDMSVARKKAEEKEQAGYLFDASGSAYSSIMKYCSDSSIRKYFYQARQSFATEEKYNNKPIILKILELRNQKAQLLGFKNYAELSLHFKMAESPEQILDLLFSISEKARGKGNSEIDEITKYFQLSDIQVWDLSYYANKLREEKYAFDSKELKKYFSFEKVLSGMFEIVERLYNIKMKKLDIESYDSEVEVYEVSRNGIFLSYFFTDYFYRPLKRHGAWANILREKFTSLDSSESGFQSKRITLNVCNFQKGTDGVTLLTLGDVETMFHEFGHAIHEMLSQSKYSELSGFNVEWDFVELPSQLLENWCRDRVGMNVFAEHFKTGESIPDDMFQKLELLETFGNGQMILTQNTYAMMDMLLHSSDVPKTHEELDAQIEKNYDQNSILPRGEVYSPHTSFSHIFDGGYAAGYYSYMWAEIIEKEVWKAFKDSGDIFSPEIAKKFHDTILSQGTTKKASELFRDFLGRDVRIDAFLNEKGLV